MNVSIEPYPIHELYGRRQKFIVWYTKINGVEYVEARVNNLLIFSAEWPEEFDWIEFEKNVEYAYEEIINM